MCFSNFTTDRSKAVLLLQFFFVCASVVSYVAFVMTLFVPHLSFFVASAELCFVIVAFPEYIVSTLTVDSRYLDIAYLE